jgi:hypothetical protein
VKNTFLRIEVPFYNKSNSIHSSFVPYLFILILLALNQYHNDFTADIYGSTIKNFEIIVRPKNKVSIHKIYLLNYKMQNQLHINRD